MLLLGATRQTIGQSQRQIIKTAALRHWDVETQAYLVYPTPAAPIAQLDRVLPSEGKGHWFESSWVRH
jgi:hypothetical protein